MSLACACAWPQLGDAYLAGLNQRKRFVMPNPPAPTPPSPPRPLAQASDASDWESSFSALPVGAQVGIVLVSCFVALVMIGGGVALWVWARRSAAQRRRWGFFGKHVPPGVGSTSTLVVTDIEGSTSLW